ncbi:TPA: amidohydrolase, partial [Streptococcus suis]|nr:amidohydrolase [Streptococcus suis]
MKIDVFAHVLLPQFYQKMLALDPALPQKHTKISSEEISDGRKYSLL